MKRGSSIATIALAMSSCTATGTTVTADNNNDPYTRFGYADEHDIHHHSDRMSAPSNNSNLRGMQRSSEQQQQQQHPTPKNPTHKSFVKNMLANQGCPPTSTCGDICYVLTIAAASDLHSVATGKTNQPPTHHWHDPASFWQAGVCNAKSQCVSVNPFDKHHNFNDLASTLADVEKECGRSIGAASMFLLAKAMEPPAFSCNTGVSYPNALN